MKYKVDIMSKPQGDVSAPPYTWLPVPPALYCTILIGVC
jgi:hypothetical protein